MVTAKFHAVLSGNTLTVDEGTRTVRLLDVDAEDPSTEKGQWAKDELSTLIAWGDGDAEIEIESEGYALPNGTVIPESEVDDHPEGAQAVLLARVARCRGFDLARKMKAFVADPKPSAESAAAPMLLSAGAEVKAPSGDGDVRPAVVTARGYKFKWADGSGSDYARQKDVRLVGHGSSDDIAGIGARVLVRWDGAYYPAIVENHAYHLDWNDGLATQWLPASLVQGGGVIQPDLGPVVSLRVLRRAPSEFSARYTTDELLRDGTYFCSSAKPSLPLSIVFQTQDGQARTLKTFGLEPASEYPDSSIGTFELHAGPSEDELTVLGTFHLHSEPTLQLFKVKPVTASTIKLVVKSNHGGEYVQLGKFLALKELFESPKDVADAIRKAHK